jgi:hypothetical protein
LMVCSDPAELLRNLLFAEDLRRLRANFSGAQLSDGALYVAAPVYEVGF